MGGAGGGAGEGTRKPYVCADGLSPPAPFPWEEALGFALGRLGWSPEAFWSATPRELALAIEARAPARADAPTRAELAALMAAFPDEIRHAQQE